MTTKHHYFLAVKLPKEIKSFLQNWIDDKREKYPFTKWVYPEDYHITLVFLGFVDERKRDELIKKVKELLSKENSFQLTLSQLGIFGLTKSPRIFWAGVNESKPLHALQKKLYDECVKMNFQLDKKPFNPHITLARKWDEQFDFQKEKLIPITTNEGKQLSFFVKEIVLYETHLNKRPKYKEFKVFSLL